MENQIQRVRVRGWLSQAAFWALIVIGTAVPWSILTLFVLYWSAGVEHLLWAQLGGWLWVVFIVAGVQSILLLVFAGLAFRVSVR